MILNILIIVIASTFTGHFFALKNPEAAFPLAIINAITCFRLGKQIQKLERSNAQEG